MEYGRLVAPSNGQHQMVRPHAPVSDEEPRTEADLRSVVGDEEEHHEKKPMMTKMKDKMRKIKNTLTKKKHGHVDDHDVQDEDETVQAEGEGEGEGEGYDDDEDEEMEMEPEIHRAPRYESTATPRGLGGGDKPFTTDRRDDHVDLGTQDSLGGRDDPLPLSSRGDHVPLSSRDDRPVTLASRDQHVLLGGLDSRGERPVSLGDQEERATLGGLQEPPVTPETIKDTTFDADLVDPLPNGSVSRTDDYGNISDPKTGNEQSVSPDVISSFQDMDISSGVEKKPSYIEKPTATAAAAKDAAVSAAATVYAKVASGNQSGETRDQIATPVSTGPGVEVELREGAGEKKGTYTEKMSSTAVAVKDAAVFAASTVYAKVAGGNQSGETHDQIATPVRTGPGVEVEPREGAGEKQGSYTEKLSSTAVAAKDAAVSAASTLYAKVAGGTHSGETHDQIATPVSTGPGVEVEPRDAAGEKKGSYTEKMSSTAVAAKDAAVTVASTVYAKVAGGTHSGETEDQIATPVSSGPGVEVEPREGAGEKKGTYTEKLTGTALAVKDAAVNAASTVYGKVTGAGTAVTGKVQPGGGTEQEKKVSVREYLAEKLRPGEEDKALCEVISESMKKKGVEEHEEVKEKGRIVLPEVTAGEIGVRRVLGKEGGGDGGED